MKIICLVVLTFALFVVTEGLELDSEGIDRGEILPCPWKGSTNEYRIVKCMYGNYCKDDGLSGHELPDSWACCSLDKNEVEHGGRKKCPKNLFSQCVGCIQG